MAKTPTSRTRKGPSTRRMVQCPCCGRGDLVSYLLVRAVEHAGNVYDHTVSSDEGKGAIENTIVDVDDPKVTAELIRRCKAFLKAVGEKG